MSRVEQLDDKLHQCNDINIFRLFIFIQQRNSHNCNDSNVFGPQV